MLNKKSKSMGIAFVVMGLISIFFGIVFLNNESLPVFSGLFFLIIGIVCLVLGVSRISVNFNVSKAKCYINNGTLTITNRNPSIAKVVLIKTDKDAIIKYEPVKIHIGAATVGGITTGGAYTTGGYNYLAGTKENGHYKLTAFNQMIYSIQLNAEQYRSAKQSSISKYLNDKHQIQVVDNLQVSATEAQDIFQNLKQSSFLYGGDSLKKGYPSYRKCAEILDWLCGNDNHIEGKVNTERDSYVDEWKCPKCGRTNQGFMEYCFDCNKKRPQEKDNNDKEVSVSLQNGWKCPDCGRVNQAFMENCFDCGKKKP